MKNRNINIFLIFSIFVLLLPLQNKAYSSNINRRNSHYLAPQIPRVSAYEAYVKFKTGKAIIIDAHHSRENSRRIIGAVHIDSDAVRKKRIKLPKLPKKGVQLLFYCYWGNEPGKEVEGASLATQYVKAGYRNVKIVAGGAKLMEQYFDHYRGKFFVSPIRGKKQKIFK